MQLYQYQLDICEQVHTRLQTKNRCIIALAGGGGKSLISAQLSIDFVNQNKHVVILTSFSALIPQLSHHLSALNIKHDIIKSGENKTTPNAMVTLIMEQSFHEKKRSLTDIKCDVLIKDEIHISTDKRFTDIVDYLEPKQTIGLSFTPIDDKGFIINGYDKDDIITIGSVKELTQQGYLCQIKTYVPKWSEEMDYSQIKLVASDYHAGQLNTRINTKEHTQLVVNAMNQMDGTNKQTLVYAVSIQHAINVTNALRTNGYNVNVVHSKQPSQLNTKLINDFRTNKLNCLVSVSSLTIGFDAPCAELLVLLRPTKILRLYLQIACRISRTYQTKQFSQLLDLAQCTSNLGFYDEHVPLISKREPNHKKKLENTMSYKQVFLSGSDTTEITRELSNVEIEQISRKTLLVSKLAMSDLIDENSTTNSINSLVITALEINSRVRSREYTKKQIKELVYAIESFIDDFPQHRQRIVETYRLRFKNTIRESRDIMGLYDFSTTLTTMYPYNKDNK